MSFQGHIPEGDGVLMGLLLVEMVATMKTPLEELVAKLLAEVGPSHYSRLDLRLSAPLAKERMVARLAEEAPAAIGGMPLASVSTLDGVKYLLEDDSWLLIRPSGTEPVLRVYAEGRTPAMVKALMDYGGRAQALRESTYPLRMVGSSIVNVLPTPGLLLALTRPPCSSTIPLQIASPEPAPCCSCLERSTWWKT